MTEDTTLRIERIIDAPRERVFAAWTTREAMEEWYRDGEGAVAAVTELDLRVGGRFRVQWGRPGGDQFVESGEYLEIDPPSRLVTIETIEGLWTDTRVTVELHDGGGGTTRVVVTHEGFASRDVRDGASGGWPGFLDRLERHVMAQG